MGVYNSLANYLLNDLNIGNYYDALENEIIIFVYKKYVSPGQLKEWMPLRYKSISKRVVFFISVIWDVLNVDWYTR